MPDLLPASPINLPNEAALREVLDNPNWLTKTSVPRVVGTHNPDYREDGFNYQELDVIVVRSQFIIDVIIDIEASGKFPYNVDVQLEAERRLGIESQPENGSKMSWLVYAAQGYRRSEKLVDEGFAPLTQQLVEAAFEAKEKVMTSNGALYTPRMYQNHLYLFLPNSRSKCLMVNPTQAAKRVPSKKAEALSAKRTEQQSITKVVVTQVGQGIKA